MIEIIAALARWLQLVANMILIGGSVFLAIAAYDRAVLSSPWVARLERALPWLAIILLLGLLAVLSTSAALATGITEHAWQPGTWLEFLQKTRTGHIWMWREGFALTVLGAVLYVRSAPRAQWRYALCATLAMLTLAVGSLASHSAAEELSVTSILPYTLHIVLAGVWFGALPAFLLILFTNNMGQQSHKEHSETLGGTAAGSAWHGGSGLLDPRSPALASLPAPPWLRRQVARTGAPQWRSPLPSRCRLRHARASGMARGRRAARYR